MSNFEIIEKSGLKMVKATINDETVFAEAGALHYMQGDIELTVKRPSAAGFLKSLVTSESVIKPSYKGSGEIFFGPPIFGEYYILSLEDSSWILDRGAFVCATEHIKIGAYKNKAVSALLSGEGLFQTEVSGSGEVVLQAQGNIEVIELENDKLVVDGSFAIAREASLDFSVQKASKGLLSSAASGEGLVNVIQGTGRVLIAPVPNIHQNIIDSIGDVFSSASTSK